MIRRVKGKHCIKCGSKDLPFYARRRNDRGTISISNSCIICHREDEAIRNRRLYRQNKAEYYRRARIYKINNQEKINKQARLNYMRKARPTWLIV